MRPLLTMPDMYGAGPDVQLVSMPNGSVVPVQITGATQGVADRLLSLTEQAWQRALEGYDWQGMTPGVNLNVTTGVSNHSPTNHAPGHAIDYYAQIGDRRLPWNDPLVRAASEHFWELGGHGVGAGPTYMGGQHYHWDISRNGVRSWSDDDGGASDRGPGAAQWLGGVSAPGGSTPASSPNLGAPSLTFGGAPAARANVGAPVTPADAFAPRLPFGMNGLGTMLAQNRQEQRREQERDEQDRRLALIDLMRV